MNHCVFDFHWDGRYCSAVFEEPTGALIELRYARGEEIPKEFDCPHEFEECVLELQRSLKKALGFLNGRQPYS